MPVAFSSRRAVNLHVRHALTLSSRCLGDCSLSCTMHPTIQPIHSSLEQHSSARNSPTRAHCDDTASVQSTDTGPHRCLCWPCISTAGRPSAHLDTRSSPSSCHQLSLRGFCVSCSCIFPLSYPGCSWVPLHRGALSQAPMLDSYAERYNDMIFQFTLLFLLTLPL